MTQYDQNRPFHSVPHGILALVILIGAVELLFTLGEMRPGLAPGAESWRLHAIIYHGILVDQAQIDLARESSFMESMSRMLTYPFIGWNFANSLISVVFLLAVGKYASSFIGQVRVLVIFTTATLLGAVGYLALDSGEVPLIGPSPGIFGLFGSLLALAVLPLKIPDALRSNLYRLPLIMVALQVGFGIFLDGNILWIPMLVGFIVGFFATIFLSLGLRDGIHYLIGLVGGSRRN